MINTSTPMTLLLSTLNSELLINPLKNHKKLVNELLHEKNLTKTKIQSIPKKLQTVKFANKTHKKRITIIIIK